MNTRSTQLTQQLTQQLEHANFLTDGGMETDLIFNKGIDLPCFASFDLLSTDWGRVLLRDYYQSYLDLAVKHGAGFILESPTWRANLDWGAKLGYCAEDLATLNREAISFLQALRQQYSASVSGPVLISGNIGPRGDGYVANRRMSAEEARAYHSHQVNTFADTAAELVSAFTLNYFDEALGIVQAARDANMPVVISFTLETDGHLPSGQSLAQAITELDHQSENYPLYYMINCAHPAHFETLLGRDEPWLQRIRGIRGNASKCSHAELDAAVALDAGNPVELGSDYRRLQKVLPNLRVYGGCCGTDLRHVASIAEACLH